MLLILYLVWMTIQVPSKKVLIVNFLHTYIILQTPLVPYYVRLRNWIDFKSITEGNYRMHMHVFG